MQSAGTLIDADVVGLIYRSESGQIEFAEEFETLRSEPPTRGPEGVDVTPRLGN